MSKHYFFIILSLLFSTGCKSYPSLPFKAGDSVDELTDFLIEKNVKTEKNPDFTTMLFQYGNKNYIATITDDDSPSIVKIKGYSTKLPKANDFYRLQFGMDIYEMAEIVGAPFMHNPYGNYLSMFYRIEDTKYNCVSVSLSDYGRHAFYEGYFRCFNLKENIDFVFE